MIPSVALASSVLSFLRVRRSLLPVVLTLCGGAQQAWAGPPATTTALAVTSGGSAATTVAWGSVVTLTATVRAGATAVKVGQVKFCDATATYCTDIHLLSTAQLTNAGTAVFKFRPGIGSHSYKAVFAGTPNGTPGYAASSSGEAPLAVTQTTVYPTTTTISDTENSGPANYALTATVTGAGFAPPAGTVSFLDTSNANAVLDTATLVAGTPTLGFADSWNLAASGILTYTSIVAADFNGDGIPDLAVADASTGKVTIFLGSEGGTFTERASLAAGTCPVAMAAGDFNGDGIPDLAVLDGFCGGAAGNGAVTVLQGNGDGSFKAVSSSPATGVYSVAIVVSDFNGDGIPDLAVANICSTDSSCTSGGTVTVLLGKGDGTFTPTSSSPATGKSPDSLAVGDFNGDGIPDLAVANYHSDTVTVLIGDGHGNFTATSTSPATGIGPVSIAVADLKGNGKADLAVLDQCGTDPSCDSIGGVTILLSNGDGTFTAAAASPSAQNNPDSIAVGDFNGDGIPDLAVANYNTTLAYGTSVVTVLQGNGDGTFIASTGTIAASGGGSESLAVADFNGDGLADLAVANNLPSNVNANAVTLLLAVETQTASATVNPVALPVNTGYHLVDANYPGDSSFSGSTSSTVRLATPLGTPTVTVMPTLADIPTNQIATNQVLTVFITVSDGASVLKPTGTVTLSSGTYSSAPADIGGTPAGAGINIPAGALAVGLDTLKAAYSGDENYLPASGTAQVTVHVPTPASLTAPGLGSTLDSSATFTWNAGWGVTEYELVLGTIAPGTDDLGYFGGPSVFSDTVSLPTNGVTVFARLYSLINGVWKYNDYTFTEAGTLAKAAISSPANNSVLPGASVKFTWAGGAGPSGYWLYLGTTGVGSTNLYSSGSTTAASVTVNGLPINGKTVYAEFLQRINGAWQASYYTYTAQ